MRISVALLRMFREFAVVGGLEWNAETEARIAQVFVGRSEGLDGLSAEFGRRRP